MRTLGLQGATSFLDIKSPHDYLVRDSHTRFLGGVWMGIGLLFLVSPIKLTVFRPMLNLAFALIFSLARFTLPRQDVLLDPGILPSLLAELVGMPLLYLWLSRSVKPSTS